MENSPFDKFWTENSFWLTYDKMTQQASFIARKLPL